MQTFTVDELNLLFLYYADSRTGQIANLEEMRGYLHEHETDLMQMTDSTLAKLRKMSDSEFTNFRGSADFDLAALGHVKQREKAGERT